MSLRLRVPRNSGIRHDISDAALDRARAGCLSDSVVADISPQRLKRFFTRVEKGYQVLQSVREICIFAKQNIAKRSAFLRLGSHQLS